MLTRRSIGRFAAAAFAAPSLAKSRDDVPGAATPTAKQADQCGPWWPRALDIDQFLTCPVFVNGARETAIIDTGFSRSGITASVIRKFSLIAGKQSESRGLSGSITSTEYELPKLQIGAFAFDGLALLGLEQTPIPMPPTVSIPQPGERQGYKAAGAALDLELADGRHVRLVLEDYF